MLLWGVALSPACVTALCIAAFSVNTPWLEEWDYVALFDKLAHNDLSWRDLVAHYNEYRQVVPNLVFLVLGSLSHGDVRTGMLVSFVLACVVSLNVYRLARLRFDVAPVPTLAAYLAANVLIFSPVQYDNWLQGQQLIFFIPIACLSTCVLLALSPRLDTPARFGWCALLCTISTFSSANGMLLWLLVLPVLVRPFTRARLKAETWWVVAWLLTAALSVAVYFHGYQRSPQLPALSAAAWQPLSAAVFFLRLLGAPLALERAWLATPVGLILLAAFGWVCVRTWRSRHESPPSAATVGWLVIGGYSLLTAILITVGRLGYGQPAALWSRYTTFTLYLPLSLVLLVPMVLEARTTAVSNAPGRRPMLRLATLVTVAVLAIHVPLYRFGISRMSGRHLVALSAKACVLLAGVVRDECASITLYPSLDRVRERANTLRRLGFLDARIAGSDNVREMAAAAGTTSGASYGSFSSLVHQGGDEYLASGEAYLPHRDSPAHLVLFAYRDPDAGDRIFAVSRVFGDRHIILAALGRASYRGGGWRKPLATGELPAGPVWLTAWAFDAYTGRAYELAGSHVLQNNAPTRPPRTP